MTRFVNSVKTSVLLGGLFGLILAAGYAFGGVNALLPAFLIGLLMNGGAYFFSDKIALASMRAQEVDERSAAPLYRMVQRLSENAGLPMPRVYICPQQAPNAFATGRSPKHAAVAVTQGALQLLNERELEGVMAHELAHVKNRDTLISAIAATVAGVLNMLGYLAIFGGGRDRAHPALMLLMMIAAPIAAGIIQMAISRSREYIADHDGAKIAGTPDGLIGALQKLESVGRRVPMAGETATQNHMFIVQPLSAGGAMGGLSKLFSTHPATQDRIAKLRAMA